MIRRLAPLVAAVLLAGCAVVPRVPTAGGAAVDPERVRDWTASGRLGIAAGNAGGSGSFLWKQRSATTDVMVRGPLGAGSMRIVTDGGTLTLTDADGRSVDTQAARDQLRARLGIELPLAELRYWMLGIAAPGSPSEVTQSSTAPQRVIEQAGWKVTCQQFIAAHGWWVPARLTAASGAARIKVVVDEWRLPEASAAPGGASQP